MQLRCKRCRRAIVPDEYMVVVEVDRPVVWGRPENVARRLELTPGRWHYRCAPQPVRQYAAVVAPEVGGIEARLMALAKACGVERATLYRRTPDGKGYVVVSRVGGDGPEFVEYTQLASIMARVEIDGHASFSIPDDVDIPEVTPRAVLVVGTSDCGLAVSGSLGHAWAARDVETLRDAARSLCA